MQTIVSAILHRRHFWKKVKFNELSELYMSLTLRALGLSLIGIFIPVYLWQQGFAIADIALFFSVVYLIRILIEPFTAKLVAMYGPKHVLRASYPLEILFLLAIIAIGNHYLPFWFGPPLLALAFSTFFIPFNADFSNVRSAKEVGKQLSLLKIFEKIAGAIGPLAGGLIAASFGFEITIVLALTVTLIAMIPLLLDGENGSQKTFHYEFKWANYKDMFDDAMVYIGRGFDITIYAIFWPLFAVITIFSAEAYAGLGLITALGLGASLFSAHLIGQLIDNRRGRQLMRVGIIVGAMVHYIRPFVTSIPGAASTNVVGDTAGSAMDMPLLKGMYYRANHYKHGRVAYLVSALSILHLTRMVSYGLLYVFLLYVSEPTALAIMIFVAATMSLFMLGEKFKALDS